MVSKFTHQHWSNRFLQKTTHQRKSSLKDQQFQLTSWSWLLAWDQQLILFQNYLTSKPQVLKQTFIFKSTTKTQKTFTLQVMSPVIHTGTMASESESNISTKLFIKVQLLVWTWQEENSQWIMFHSSGPDNGITHLFLVVSIMVGMIFILLVT